MIENAVETETGLAEMRSLSCASHDKSHHCRLVVLVNNLLAVSASAIHTIKGLDHHPANSEIVSTHFEKQRDVLSAEYRNSVQLIKV